MSVAVVTDSTAYLPEGMAQRYGIRQVPMHVMLDGRSRLDGVQLGPSELVAALARRATVSTSRPTPGEFETVYAEALRDGADGVVSVHLSRALSGTWEAARLAAEQIGAERVRVLDSRSTGMGLGFAALAAAAAAAADGQLDDVAETAQRVAARTHIYFSVDTLEYLRRGGRIGAAAALLGTALAVKPLLYVDSGRIVLLEKVRTAARARNRLVELVVQAAGSDPVDLAVHHLGAVDRAMTLVEQLHDRLPKLSECHVSEVGAAIGAHAGPGMLAVVVLPGGLATTSVPADGSRAR